MEAKTCSRCKRRLSITLFGKYLDKRFDKVYVYSYCRECRNKTRGKYRKQWRRDIKPKILRLISDDIKCVWCGEEEFDYLEIDHKKAIADTKQKRIHGEMLYAELKRNPRNVREYQILCRACNLLKESIRLRKLQKSRILKPKGKRRK